MAVDWIVVEANPKNPHFDSADFSMLLQQWMAHWYIPSLLVAPVEMVSIINDCQVQPNPTLQNMLLMDHHQQKQRQQQTNENGKYERRVFVTNSGSSSSSANPLWLTRSGDGTLSNQIRALVSYAGSPLILLTGHLTGCLHRLSMSLLQPMLEEGLNEMLDLYDDVNPTTHIGTHMLVGGLLSPLEMARTRIMTQSYFTGRSSYPTVLHALQAIPDEEDDSSWTILYSPRVLAPALFHHALVPSLRLVSNHIISEHLDLSEDMTPVLFHLTRLALLAVEVFITTPFELARRRLHLQRLKPPRSKLSKSQRRRLESSTRNRPMYYRRVTVDEDDLEADGGPENDELLEDLELEECMHAQPYFTSVQVSSTFYLNTWDVFQSIVKDEGGPVVKPPRRRKTALHPYSSVLRPAVTANDSAPADRLDTRVSQVATRQPPSSLAMIWSNNNSDNSGQTSPIPPAQFSPLDNWPRSASPTLGMASEWDGVEYSRALHSSKLNASITELPNPSPPSTSSVYPPPRSSSPTYSIASTSYTSYSAVKMASMYRPGTWHSFWVGLQSLYRSVGANYTREVIYYGFNELKKLDSDW